MTATETQSPSFYTPTSREVYGGIEHNGRGNTNPQIRGVVDTFVQIASSNRTTVFHNGDDSYSFQEKANRQSLDTAVESIVTARCSDYFDESGSIHPDHKITWNNIKEIAPEIAGILLSKEHNIKGVSRDQIGNIFAFAIDVVKNPDLISKTTISTGYGGSADHVTSSRLPSYGLPAELIATKVNAFYQNRLINAIDEQRTRKYVRSHIEEQEYASGKRLGRKERREIQEEAERMLAQEKQSSEDGNTSSISYLTNEELDDVKARYAIPDKPMQLRFFSGAEAGIESNFSGKAEAVRTRREQNWDVIRAFTAEHFPDLELAFQNDIPWNEHSIEQQTVLEYYAHILRTSQSESIKKTLTFLEGLGHNKGGEQGKELAAEYAGLHVSFFKDRVNLPSAYTNFFGIEHVFEKPEVSIMIGGKSEEMFCGVRDYIVEHASPEGLRDFALLKATRLELEEAQNAQQRGDTLSLNGSAPELSYHTPQVHTLRHMAKRLDKWKDAITKRRAKYGTTKEKLAPSDRPSHNISLISGTEIAPYYVGPGDEPHGVNIDEQIERIKQTDFIPSEPEYAPIANAAEIHAKAAMKDLLFMQKVTKKAA